MKSQGLYTSPDSPCSMNTTTEIPKLLRAKTRMEKKLKELDLKIDHVLFRMNEEKRCMTRKCPLDTDNDQQR